MHYTDCLAFLGRDLALDHFRASDIDSLRAMLDKYGFRQAVACSTAARTSAIERDHEILFAAAQVDARIVPCPVVVPDCCGETGESGAFLDMLIARGARAACLYPATSGTTTDERILGDLLEAMEARRLPLYLFETGALAARDLAERHPLLPVVLYRLSYRDRVWLDCVRDTPNLYVNTASNFCPYRGLERLAEAGAADRVLMGSAYPECEPGAAIGMVMSADLPEETIQAMAAGNLQRLISQVRTNQSPAEPPAPEGGAWESEGLAACFARRRPMALEGVIDMHGHLGHSHRFSIHGGMGDDLVAEMDRVGIETMLVSHEACMSWDVQWGNNQVLEAMQAHPGRILGYAVCYAGDTAPGEPSQSALAEVERCLDAGMAGIKMHNGDGIAYDDERYGPVWDYAEANELPVLLHTWGKLAEIETVLEKVKRAPVLLGHSGAGSGPGPYIEIAKRHENVYLEICWSMAPYRYVEEFVAALGPGRVLFGSDGTWFSLGHQLGRVLFADISEADKRTILVENPARILERRQ